MSKMAAILKSKMAAEDPMFFKGFFYAIFYCVEAQQIHYEYMTI